MLLPREPVSVAPQRPRSPAKRSQHLQRGRQPRTASARPGRPPARGQRQHKPMPALGTCELECCHRCQWKSTPLRRRDNDPDWPLVSGPYDDFPAAQQPAAESLPSQRGFRRSARPADSPLKSNRGHGLPEIRPRCTGRRDDRATHSHSLVDGGDATAPTGHSAGHSAPAQGASV